MAELRQKLERKGSLVHKRRCRTGLPLPKGWSRGEIRRRGRDNPNFEVKFSRDRFDEEALKKHVEELEVEEEYRELRGA